MNTRIKELRKEHKLTLQQLGDKIGISNPALSNIENGKTNPSDQTVKSLCREFGVREEWLRTGEGKKYLADADKQLIVNFMTDVLKEEDDSFRRRLITAMSYWDERDWNDMERLILTLKKKRD